MAPEPQKPIDEVVSELGRYPIDAFDFLREGLKFTVENVHGEPSQLARQVHEWMVRRDISIDTLTELYEASDLPRRVTEAIEKIGGPEGLNRHVSGQQLCQGLRDFARNRWGLLAPTVLYRWNIRKTEDFGRMVFALVDNDYLQKQPDDRIDDFQDVFDFNQAFDDGFAFDTDDPEL